MFWSQIAAFDFSIRVNIDCAQTTLDCTFNTIIIDYNSGAKNSIATVLDSIFHSLISLVASLFYEELFTVLQILSQI